MVSVSSLLKDSELSSLDEHNRTQCVFQSLSSNTVISTASSIDMYDQMILVSRSLDNFFL